MPTYTQVTCQYNVNLIAGPASTLSAAVSAVALDAATLELLGVTSTSDTTAIVGTSIQRTIVLSLAQPPTISVKNPQTNNFSGYLVSTQTFDKPGDAGVEEVTINYFDQTGAGPFAALVPMNGTTPVSVKPYATNIANVVSIINTTMAPGGLGSNWGVISLSNDAHQEVAYLPEGFYVSWPDGTTDQAIPFNDWMKKKIEQAIGYEVIALAPVLA